MNRRQLIKNLGLGGVALVATPSVLSLLQSCKNEPVFTPSFLSMQQGKALRHIVDLIIPSDEAIPGAVDIGVHQFIDNFWNEVITLENQEHTKAGFDALADRLLDATGKTFETAAVADYDTLLAKYLTVSKEQGAIYNKSIGAYKKDKTIKPDADAGTYSLLGNIRGMTVWGWKSSEEIGENVLAYEPIPAQQVGCLPVSEATGGKAYSLP